jgi:4-hydroxybenzoate polyprenyltransferase
VGVTPILREAGAEVERWAVYQRERFPLAAHGPLIAAFTSAAVCVSALLRHPGAGEAMAAPGWRAFVAAFGSGLLLFFQLRVADEFKDVRDDARHRAYRPVPRRLVSLRELRALGLGAALAQAALAAWVAPRLLWCLVGVWGYMLLMGQEFFVARWMHHRPAATLLTHMLIVPLIDLYATAFDWVPRATPAPDGLLWFALASLGNGLVVELGRKVRATGDEEPGVPTYSAQWGRQRAVIVLLAVMCGTLLCALQLARLITTAWLGPALLALVVVATAVVARRFVLSDAPGSGRRFELLSAVHTLALYAGCGILPFMWIRFR